MSKVDTIISELQAIAANPRKAMEDYKAAKRDFAARSKLVESQRILSDAELAAVRDACEFMLKPIKRLHLGSKICFSTYKRKVNSCCHGSGSRSRRQVKNRGSFQQWSRHTQTR